MKKIICDICEEPINENEVENNDYVHIEKEFGYWSHGFDGEHHSIDICNNCYAIHVYSKTKNGRREDYER